MSSLRCPFEPQHQLVDHSLSKTSDNTHYQAHLYGYPKVLLNDVEGLLSFLEKDLLTPDLDQMAPYLWMMSTQSSQNINALHHQRVKGRDIVLTEHPRLHLIWIHERIFIKPLPKYLMSHSFWTEYLLDQASPLGDRRPRLVQAALGFMRTYQYLIQYESDIRIAQQDDLSLVPRDTNWQGFCGFTRGFSDIIDEHTTPRYQFGELRLTRLNFYIKFLLRRAHYRQLHGQCASYFARFYGPILFILGVLSVMLITHCKLSLRPSSLD